MTIKAFVFDAYGTLFDVQSVSVAVESAYPGQGEYLTQIWRMKQLEYSWLCALMRQYKNFRTITRDALVYALRTIGVRPDHIVINRVVAAFDALTLYPEAAQALSALKNYQLAILSNGSHDMLDTLLGSSDLAGSLDAVISVELKQTYKPDPRAYELVQERLGVLPEEVAFVTSNGFDAAGARSFGFRVVRIERTSPLALKQELLGESPIGASSMYRALRTQTEELGHVPDAVVDSLLALPELVQTLNS